MIDSVATTMIGHFTLLAGVLYTAYQNREHRKSIDQVQVLVNGQTARLLAEIEQLRAELARRDVTIAALQAGNLARGEGK